jgi:hypothetical protein
MKQFICNMLSFFQLYQFLLFKYIIFKIKKINELKSYAMGFTATFNTPLHCYILVAHATRHQRKCGKNL